MVKSQRTTETLRLDGVFHALSDPTRRSILRDVSEREKTVGEIARPYRSSLAAISKHIHVLAESGLVTRRKEGSFQFVRINPMPMKDAQRWLSHYEKFWNERLDQFQHNFGTKKIKKENNR